MDVTISSSGIQVSQRLGETTRTKVGKLDRYLSGIDHATVRFSEEKNPRIPEPDICEVTLEGQRLSHPQPGQRAYAVRGLGPGHRQAGAPAPPYQDPADGSPTPLSGAPSQLVGVPATRDSSTRLQERSPLRSALSPLSG